MTLPILHYFSSRGRAEMIRLVCAEAAIGYEERALGVYHPVDKTPAFLALRATGVLPFGAVPLWEEPDGFRLAESDAIVRHLARTHDLAGKDAREAARCDMTFVAVDEIRLEVRKLAAVEAPGRAALRAELAQTILPRWLGHLERQLVANGGGTAVGAAVTYADIALFYLYESLHDNRLGAAYAACPALAAHGARMAARPSLAGYLAAPTRFPPQVLPE